MNIPYKTYLAIESALRGRIAKGWEWRNDGKYWRDTLKGDIAAIRWIREIQK